MERKCGIALTMPYRNIQNLKNILMKALKTLDFSRFDALCGNDLATVFIIPKRKSYLICESQVALFVLLIFARLLLQFIHQQIA